MSGGRKASVPSAKQPALAPTPLKQYTQLLYASERIYYPIFKSLEALFESALRPLEGDFETEEGASVLAGPFKAQRVQRELKARSEEISATLKKLKSINITGLDTGPASIRIGDFFQKSGAAETQRHPNFLHYYETAVVGQIDALLEKANHCGSEEDYDDLLAGLSTFYQGLYSFYDAQLNHLQTEGSGTFRHKIEGNQFPRAKANILRPKSVLKKAQVPETTPPPTHAAPTEKSPEQRFADWQKRNEKLFFNFSVAQVGTELPKTQSTKGPNHFYVLDRRDQKMGFALYQQKDDGGWREVPLYRMPCLKRALSGLSSQEKFNGKPLKLNHPLWTALAQDRNYFLPEGPLHLKNLELLKLLNESKREDPYYFFIVVSIIMDETKRYPALSPVHEHCRSLYFSFLEAFPELKGPETTQALLKKEEYETLVNDILTSVNADLDLLEKAEKKAPPKIEHATITQALDEIKQQLDHKIEEAEDKVKERLKQSTDWASKIHSEHPKTVAGQLHKKQWLHELISELKNARDALEGDIEQWVGFGKQQMREIDKVKNQWAFAPLQDSMSTREEDAFMFVEAHAKTDKMWQAIKDSIGSLKQIEDQLEEASQELKATEVKRPPNKKMEEVMQAFASGARHPIETRALHAELAKHAPEQVDLYKQNRRRQRDGLGELKATIQTLKEELGDKAIYRDFIEKTVKAAEKKLKAHEAEVHSGPSPELQACYVLSQEQGQFPWGEVFGEAFNAIAREQPKARTGLALELKKQGYPVEHYFDGQGLPKAHFLRNHFLIQNILQGLKEKDLQNFPYTKALVEKTESLKNKFKAAHSDMKDSVLCAYYEEIQKQTQKTTAIESDLKALKASAAPKLKEIAERQKGPEEFEKEAEAFQKASEAFQKSADLAEKEKKNIDLLYGAIEDYLKASLEYWSKHSILIGGTPVPSPFVKNKKIIVPAGIAKMLAAMGPVGMDHIKKIECIRAISQERLAERKKSRFQFYYQSAVLPFYHAMEAADLKKPELLRASIQQCTDELSRKKPKNAHSFWRFRKDATHSPEVPLKTLKK